VFYPNENKARDRYEAPGNWRRRLMKTKRERSQQEPGSLNSRERNVAPGSLTTLDGGRYANLISRKWTSHRSLGPADRPSVRACMRACVATLMREALLGAERLGMAARAQWHKPIPLRSHDRARLEISL